MGVNLTKGQKISLKKENGGEDISSITLGLGWDVGSQQIDLDASCATFDANNNLLESIYYGNMQSRNKSIIHSGDNLTGKGDGDDEQINVELNKLPDQVQNIVFAVTSYRGQKFTAVKNAYVRIINRTTGAELCRYALSDKFDTTGIIMARLYRNNGEWKFAALGDGADGRTISDLIKPIKAILA